MTRCRGGVWGRRATHVAGVSDFPDVLLNLAQACSTQDRVGSLCQHCQRLSRLLNVFPVSEAPQGQLRSCQTRRQGAQLGLILAEAADGCKWLQVFGVEIIER